MFVGPPPHQSAPGRMAFSGTPTTLSLEPKAHLLSVSPQPPLRLDTDNSLFRSRRQAAPSGCTAAPLLWASLNPAFPTWPVTTGPELSASPAALPASSSHLPGPAWNAHVAPAGSSRECPHVDSQLWVACLPAQRSLKVGRLHIFNKGSEPDSLQGDSSDPQQGLAPSPTMLSEHLSALSGPSNRTVTVGLCSVSFPLQSPSV